MTSRSGRQGKSTRGAVLRGARTIEIIERDLPEITPRGGLVRIGLCGLCGTDLHAWRSGDLFPPDTVIGHEPVGTIAAIGTEVTEVAVGDRVAIAGFVPCAACEACRRGTESLCRHRLARSIGASPEFPGALSDFVFLADVEQMTLRLPDDLPLETAVFAESLAVAVHAVRTSRFQVGDRAAVVGAGPIGLLVIQVLRAAGASKLIASQPPGTRADLARQLGADIVLDSSHAETPVGQRVKEVTDGGADVVFECAGVADALNDAISMAGPAGEVILVGANTKPSPITPVYLIEHEISLRGSHSWTRQDFGAAIDLLSSAAVDTDELLTAVIDLERVQADGLERLDRDRSVIKLAVRPSSV